MALLSNQFPGEIRYAEGSIFCNFLNRLKERIKFFSATSLFWRWLKKESLTPDIYRESVIITHIVRPLLIKSHLSYPLLFPQIMFALAIFMLSVYNPVISYTHLAKLRLGFVLFPVIFIMGIMRDGSGFPRITTYDAPLLLFFLIAVISLHRVQDIYALFFGMRELMSLGLFVLSIYMVVYVFKKRDIKKLFSILGLAAILASSLYIFCVTFLKNGEVYLRNTFGNSNHLGYFLFLTYPLVFALSMDSSRTSLWRGGMVLIISGIFLTQSLGVWLLFFLSLPVMAITFKKKWPLLVFTLLIAVFILCPELRHKFSGQIATGYGSTILARIEVWKKAFSAIYERPFSGLGIGQFAASAKPYYAREMYNAFSVFFHLAATTGIAGFTFFLWFLVSAFRLNISLLRTERLYSRALFTSLGIGAIGFLWDTQILAVMTNWLLGILWGSLVVIGEGRSKIEESIF